MNCEKLRICDQSMVPLFRSNPITDVTSGMRMVPFTGCPEQMGRVARLMLDRENVKYYYWGNYPKTAAEVEQEYIALLKDPGELMWEVSPHGEARVGMFSWTVKWDKRRVEQTLVVAREAQGNGIGLQVATMMRAAAKELGFLTYVTVVHEKNEASHKVNSHFPAQKVWLSKRFSQYALDLSSWQPPADLRLVMEQADVNG